MKAWIDLRKNLWSLWCCNSWFISESCLATPEVVKKMKKQLGSLCPGESLSGGSLSRGISVWGISIWGISVQGVSARGVSVQGGLHPGVSIQEGVSVQGGLCLGSLYPGGSPSRGSPSRRGSLSREVCAWGVSIQGGLHPEGLHPGGGLCPGGSLFRGSLSGRPPCSNEWAVRILLEYILVYLCLMFVFHTVSWNFIVFP